MNWLVDLLVKESVAQSLVLLCLAVFPGVWLGNRSLGGIKMGIAGVLFSGLAVGALGIALDKHVMHFAREFGLILFVFAVGLQVGPGFFANFRDQGLKLNAYAAAIVLLGVLVAFVEYKWLGIPLEAMVGVLSGAVTNTPGLGAAQQALKDVPSFGEAAAAVSGTGYAVAYPFGICGIILTMLAVRFFFKIQVERESASYAKANSRNDAVRTFTVEVRNPMIHGKDLGSVQALLDAPAEFSRLYRSGQLSVPDQHMALCAGDLLHVVCAPETLDKIVALIGAPSELDLRHVASDVSARHVLISSDRVAGQPLCQLRLLERHGVRITRILRSGLEFVPEASQTLQLGDQLTVVGRGKGLAACAQELGDSHGALEHPDLLPIFLGILLGVLLGSIPIRIPGLPTPVKLGLAGGPLVIALLMGYKRRIAGLNMHLPASASLFMKEIGILLFLAAVGLTSGQSLVQALAKGDGWLWMGAGVGVTLIPLMLVGIFARLRGLNYLALSGLLAGSMTDPPALGYANSLSSSSAQSTAYASVYPLTMFLRVMTAQLFVMMLAS